MWTWHGEVKGYHGFSTTITPGKAVLECRDNFGKLCWTMDTEVKVPKKKPSEEELQRLAGAAYSAYIRSIENYEH